MTFREFLQFRLDEMQREMERHPPGINHSFWKGRMLSYQDALSAANGTTLLRAPKDGGNVIVEATH